MKYSFFLILFFLTSCSFLSEEHAHFLFTENENGVELKENNQSIYFYQKALVTVPENPGISKESKFNHYIHPLYGIDGSILTEAQPPEDVWHPHHRGIFWAWHQLYYDNESLGDSWGMNSISFDIQKLTTEVKKKYAKLILQVNWISDKNDENRAFMQENTIITAYPTSLGKRILDFDIKLTPLLKNISIGGSKDEKGYGGFSIRIKLPEDLIFRSNNGEVIPKRLQVMAGPWMDFSVLDTITNTFNGLSLLSFQDSLNSSIPWILRASESMQNAVFPGTDRYTLKQGESLDLKYRIIIHKNTEADIQEINEWYKDYLDK